DARLSCGSTATCRNTGGVTMTRQRSVSAPAPDAAARRRAWFGRGMLALMLPVLLVSEVAAHHSAALFYSMDTRITLQGEVARFNFRNPHAILELLVTNEQGEVERWTCETSAPSALRRRGWSQDSIVAGESVTIEGVPSSD